MTTRKVTEMYKASPVFNDPPNHVVDINNGNEFEYQWRLYSARFEYAWRYFNFHAAQRTTMFNYFVVFSGFLINACIALFQKDDYLPLLLASGLGTVITLFFIFLERRNEELVHVAEDILRALERDVLFKDLQRVIRWPKQRAWCGKMIEDDQRVPLGIFIRQDYDESQNRKSKYAHGKWLPLIELIIACAYLSLVLWSFYHVVRCVAPSIFSFRQCVCTLFPA
jgi:hypothetical protein